MERIDQTIAALADPTRRAVIDLLRKKPHTPSEIADRLDTSRPAMSKHLKVLRQAGLVEEELDEDDARVRTYQLRHAPFKELRSWVEEVEAFWTDQLASFKAHAESRERKRAGAQKK